MTWKAVAMTRERTTERERELESRMTRIAVTASAALHEARTLTSEDAAESLGIAIRAIEQIARK